MSYIVTLAMSSEQVMQYRVPCLIQLRKTPLIGGGSARNFPTAGFSQGLRGILPDALHEEY